MAMSVLAIVSYIFTSNIKEMTLITLIYTFVQIIVYFLHERVWAKIKWGVVDHPLSKIPVTKKLTPQDRQEI